MLKNNDMYDELGISWLEQPKPSFQALGNCLYLLFSSMDRPAIKEESFIFFSNIQHRGTG